MIKLRKKLRSLKQRLFPPSEYQIAIQNSDNFISYLRGKAVSIGEGCTFYTPHTQVIDLTRPELITIGNKVKIVQGCTILTHGFDWCVLRELYPGKIFGSAGEVKICDNVFIGARSIILKNTVIENNCVIGAGSVVTKNIPANSVAAGNPARVIMSIEELYDKYKSHQLGEAKKYAQIIYEKRKKLPEPSDFHEFFFLFMTSEQAEKNGLNVMKQTTPEYYEQFKNGYKRPFETFDDFLKYCSLKK